MKRRIPEDQLGSLARGTEISVKEEEEELELGAAVVVVVEAWTVGQHGR